jgi:hypothetical protein
MIAQACDLCVASTSAKFAITEVKVGRSSPWAAPLIHMIPQRIMMEIILAGKPISALRDRFGQSIGRAREAHERCDRARHRNYGWLTVVRARRARDRHARHRDGTFSGFACSETRFRVLLHERGRAGRSQSIRGKTTPTVEGTLINAFALASGRYLRTALRLLLERGADGGLRASAANIWLSKFETFGARRSGSRFLYGNAPSIQRVASP